MSKSEVTARVAVHAARLREIAAELECAGPFALQLPDELRPISALEQEWGHEKGSLVRAVKRHGVRTIKIGRQLCARRSDVVRIVDLIAEQAEATTRAASPSTTPEEAYRRLLESPTPVRPARPRRVA